MHSVSSLVVWYEYAMLPATTLRTLAFDDAVAHVDGGAAFADMRPTDAYLEVHIPGSLPLVYEFGPGMAARARDCLPLSIPLVLLEDPAADMANAAAALRGKGFTVLGQVSDAINSWVRGGRAAASTEVVSESTTPAGLVLDVGDPGAVVVESALRIPIERLWARTDEIERDSRVVVVAGFGVRAGLAVGILERARRGEILFWKARAG
jgi:rhodanese-related sulfurtransferase